MSGTASGRVWLLWGLAAAAVLANAGLGRWNVSRLADDEALVAHTLRVKETLETVTRLTVDAESGVRGFLLTGDRTFLETYRTASAELPAQLADLVRLVRENPDQAARAAALTDALAAKTAATDGLVRLADVNADAAAAEVTSGRPKRLMDTVRTRAAEMAAEEDRLLLARGSDAERLRSTTVFSLLVGAALALTMGGVGLVLGHRELEARIAAEAAARESEARFRTMADSIPQLAWTAKADGFIDWYNRRWYEYTGTTFAEMAGWGWQNVHDPKVLPEVMVRWPAAVAAGEPFEMTFPLRAADGTFRQFLTRAVPIRDAAGAVVRWFGTNTDVQDAEDAAAVAAERTRLAELRADVAAGLEGADRAEELRRTADVIVRHTGAAFARIWTTDAAGEWLVLEASAGQYTHLDGPHARVRVGEFKIGRIAATAKPHLTNDVPNDPEVGDRAWAAREGMVAFAGYPLVIEGKVLGVLALFVRRELSAELLAELGPVADRVADYLDRRRAEDALRASEEQFRSLAEAVPQFVWVTATDGAVAYFNGNWYAYTGLTEAESLGSGWTAALHPDDAARATARWKASTDTGAEYAIEYRLRGRDGAYRWFLGRGLPQRDAAGTLARWFGTCTDIHDAKLAAEAIAQNEARFRTLTEAVPHIVWNADAVGNLTYVNTRWVEFTGRGLAESAADAWYGTFHPDDREAFRHAWRETVAKAAAGIADRFAVEVRLLRDDSAEYRWFLTVAVPLRRADGSVDQWIGSMADIHDQKTAVDKVAASEARFRTLTETVPQMVWTADPAGTVTFFNSRWTEYTGTTAETRSEVPDLIHPDEAAAVRAAWRTAIADGADRFAAEFRLRRHGGGEYRWMLSVAVPARDAAGRVTQWVGSITDIHDQKRLAEILEQQVQERTAALSAAVQQLSEEVDTRTKAEESLAEQQNFLDAILENVADGIVACDAAGELKLFNAASRQFHGLPAEPLPRDRWAERYNLYDADGATPLAPDRVPLARALAGERVRDAEMVIRAAGRPDRFLLASGQPLTDARGRNLGAVVSMRDVTERRTAEVRLREFAAALQASNRELEQFASVASHDLQEPLRKIQAFGDRLATRQRDQLGEQGRDYLDRILASAGRMRRLIDDLLAFSRVSMKPRQTQPVNLDAVARDVLIDLEERLLQSGGTVTVGPLPTVVADPTHMRQLFQNLIGNALKFARPGVPPDVTVTAEPDAAGVRLTFADNGIGFDPKYLDRMFQVFQRLHGRDEYEGTGVGLAICRKIVERTGGTITARSAPGRGAEFLVDLPASPPGERNP